MKLFLTLLIAIVFWFGITPSSHAVKLETESNTIITRVGNTVGGTAPPITGDARQAIIDRFGITMNGFDQNHLQWTWERLWEVSGTHFLDLIRGSTVQARADGISSQVGCFGGQISLYLGQYYPKEFFKFILLHEFGHVVQACNPTEITQLVAQRNAYNSEGAISWYAGNTGVCFGPSYNNNYNEDYADMLAYYLDNTNPSWTSGPASCVPALERTPINPYLRGFNAHRAVAQQVMGK